eukprot:COSAG02_NODE_2589_length_8471_cov_113.759556_10_plen_53_part_00
MHAKDLPRGLLYRSVYSKFYLMYATLKAIYSRDPVGSSHFIVIVRVRAHVPC